MRILIAEDDKELLKSLVFMFTKENYIVDGVSNGEDALDYAMTDEYDGLIFDVMMPIIDGITVLKKLRQNGITTPALFLTAKTETYQKVEGLDAGADDYISKPFSTTELFARVRAMLRRKDSFVPDLLTYKNIILNRSTYEISFNNKAISLSGKEFQLMEIMLQKPNAIITTDQFMTHIWGWDSSVDISVIWAHISNIRKKIEILNAPIKIKYIRGAGYLLEGDL